MIHISKYPQIFNTEPLHMFFEGTSPDRLYIFFQYSTFFLFEYSSYIVKNYLQILANLNFDTKKSVFVQNGYSFTHYFER
jgi:hypothetical protein